MKIKIPNGTISPYELHTDDEVTITLDNGEEFTLFETDSGEVRIKAEKTLIIFPESPSSATFVPTSVPNPERT